MSLFEFVLVMASLVLGIGVTHLLQGVAIIIRHRDTLSIDWIPLTWATAAFVMAASFWWALWDFRTLEWTFPAFFFLLTAPAVLYLAMSLLLPADVPGPGESLRDSFELIRVPFMILMTAFQVMVSWDGWLIAGEEFWNPLRWAQVAMLGVLVLAASTPRRSIQRVAAVVGLSLVLLGTFVFRFLPGAFGPTGG